MTTVTATSSRDVSQPLAGGRQPARARWGFPEFFIISQTVLPGLLYLPGTQAIRIPIRIGAFAISLAALVWWLVEARKAARPHPSRAWLVGAMAYLAVQVFHPATNSLLAGLAQMMLYLAVMAPLFWAPDLVRDKRQLSRLMAILLICNGINAVVGVLQVYDPDRWLPKEFTSVKTVNETPLAYVGPDGKRVIRPPGLGDSPGAVCGPAAVAATIGVAFCAMGGIAPWRRLASLALAFAGITAIYLSQVRTSILVLGGCMATYVAVLYFQRERMKAAVLAGGIVALFVGALVFASGLGGTSVTERVATLFADDPGTVYYKAGRGGQMERAFRYQLNEYPAGAGLGRWGMMRYYFGDERNADSPLIWAELQYPAWLLDGGIPLMVLYTGALCAATWAALRLLPRRAGTDLHRLAAIVFTFNLGTLAWVFGYTPFTNQFGLQYWFVAGALHGVAQATGAAAPGAGRPRE